MLTGSFLRGILFPATLQLSCLTNACFDAFRKIPTALSNRSHSVLPTTGAAGCGFMLPSS